MKLRCPECGTVHELSAVPAAGESLECVCGHRFFSSPGGGEEADGSEAGGPRCPACGGVVDMAGFGVGEELVCPHCGTVSVVSRSESGIGAGAGGRQAGAPEKGNGPAAGAMERLPAGTVLGRCRIDRILGQGAMGVVYLARHETLDIPVAVKVLLPELASQSEYKARFYREARTAARLNHPNIVRVHDCGEEGDLLYLVMEYVDGGNLRDLLDARGRLDLRTTLEIGIAMCHALEEAARHGIVHRDIKPDNIMRTRDDVYKLADLGLARQIAENRKGTDGGLTMTAMAMGTPYYMPPEQAVDARTCDARADIYALGATLYHLLVGRPPFTGKTTFEIVRQHISGTCPPPSSLNTEIPKALDAVLGRAMMKSPEQRYATAGEFLEALEQVHAGLEGGSGSRLSRRGTSLPPVGVPAANSASRNPRILFWLGAGLVVIALGILGAVGFRRHCRRAAGGSAGGGSQGAALPVQKRALPLTLRRFESDYLEFPGGKHSAVLILEAAFDKGGPGSGQARRVPAGMSLLFRGRKFEFKKKGDGSFSLRLPLLDPLKKGEVVELRWGEAAPARGGRVSLRAPEVLDGPPTMLPKGSVKDPAAWRQEIPIRWKLAPGGRGVHYRIEVGVRAPGGGWKTLFGKEVGVDADSIVLAPKSFWYGLARRGIAEGPPSPRLALRLIAYKDVAVGGGAALFRTSAVSEYRLPHTSLPEGAGSALPGPERVSLEVSEWRKRLKPDYSIPGPNTRLCERLRKTETPERTAAALWRICLGDNKLESYWAAYALAAVIPAKAARRGIRLAFPHPFELARRLRELRAEVQDGEGRAYPENFVKLVDRFRAFPLAPPPRPFGGGAFRPGRPAP